VVGTGAIIQEITDRKRAEETLRESELRARAAREESERLAAQLDAFLAVSPVGFALLDTELRYTRVNEALAEMNGVPIEAMLGRRPGDVLETKIASVAESMLRRVLETREPVVGLELVGRTLASGVERCWHSTYYPVTTKAGVLIGVGGVVQEITERKRAESQREQLLERESAARREAERAIRLRDEFLAIVSHDLRSPLAAILLGSAVLVSERRPSDVGPVAERIRASARRMDRMIEDLLDVAQVEAGRLHAVAAPVSAADILRETYETHAPAAQAANVHLDVSVPDPLLEAFCDRGRVLQVMANLCGNAIKFTASGGTVVLGCTATAEELIFSVADTGPGIPEPQLSHVFERFWQGRRGVSGGLGLGLHIAKALVELQGGRIWVESKEGVGTTFQFALPRVRGAMGRSAL
jgi:PAS domain S-box-containing protein